MSLLTDKSNTVGFTDFHQPQMKTLPMETRVTAGDKGLIKRLIFREGKKIH